MKILFVISSMRAGGAERVMANLCDYFCNEHEIFLAKFDDESPFYTLDKRVNVLNLAYGVEDMGIIRNLKKRISKIFALRKVIKNGNFDVVISFIDNSNILTTIANFGLKTPLIISEHTNHLLLKSKFWIALRRLVYPFADALSVLSEFDMKYYTFVKNKRIIYNPITITPNYDKNSKQKLILAVGRLIDLKGFDVFIKAVSMVDKSLLKDYKIQIAGDGVLKDELMNLAKNLDVDIQFLGNRKDILEIYKKANIFVLSSKMEGFPNVLIEAMANGCCVVANDCKTGPSEIIEDGKNGFLTPFQDSAKMARAIQTLIEDEKLQESFAMASIESVKNLDIKIIAQKWIDFIEDVKAKR